jgi:hypothetical protein
LTKKTPFVILPTKLLGFVYPCRREKEGDVMAAQTKRATIYFEPDLHKALRLKAVETNQSLSELVNEAVREALAEDAEDLAAFEDKGEEPVISYDEMVMKLRKDGPI